MRDNLIAPFLASVGSHKTGSSDKAITGPCPLAPYTHQSGSDKHPSFGIFRGPGAKGNCFSCGFAGPLVGLVLRLRDYEKKNPSGRPINLSKAMEVLEAQEQDDPLLADSGEPTIDEQAFSPPVGYVYVWPESYLDRFEDAYTQSEVHPYLSGRAIDCITARRLDIKWDPKDERICFPLRDFHGRLCGVHGRSIHAEVEPRYKVYLHNGHSNQTVWFGEHLLDHEKPVVIVESVFDLARVYPIWPNVITPRSAGFPQEALKRLDGLTYILTLGDNDKAGDEFRDRISKVKGAFVCHASVAPFKDPGEADEETIRTALDPLLSQDDISVASLFAF